MGCSVPHQDQVPVPAEREEAGADGLDEFPDWEVRRAWTSRMIIRKVKERDGTCIDYITEAMDKLSAEGFEQVIVQPTHIMNGIEYDDIVNAVVAHVGKDPEVQGELWDGKMYVFDERIAVDINHVDPVVVGKDWNIKSLKRILELWVVYYRKNIKLYQVLVKTLLLDAKVVTIQAT